MTTCSVAGCDHPPVGRKLCKNHYEQVRRAGGIPPRKDRSACVVEGCGKIVVGNGYCDAHYRRWRRTGSPDRTPVTPEQRFWRYVTKGNAEECWTWTGAGWPSGYGSLRISRDCKVAVHRFSYELHVGPIPEGLVIDHLCRNRGCVNPAHLEPVTFAENILRGEGTGARYARRSECLRGHSFDPPNGYLNKQGGRSCHACDRIRYERSQARKKEATEAAER